ncbi:Hypothetical protein CAP_2830 [Chondromyces apiculatus DSM 436]|uniref:Sulfatase-modifying factor enzyme-like domain-containing protein n=1 Tax=Chondromyces apiculatus DSM 436 TaxID=1192034 RepID=A0A017T9B0_9BACT|nr:Hypothetical protein CAP_2830 [Chondromyces apiculatus DSM 436]
MLSAATVAAAVAPATAQKATTLDLGGVPLEMRRVSKGSFAQGSPEREPGRESDEAPRQVTLSLDLDVGIYPVTRGQFTRFVQDTAYRTEAELGTSGGFGWNGSALVQRTDFTWKNPGFPQTDQHPVTLVTFKDAQAFITWAAQKTGRRLRLPTEAEFEYAARAGTTTPWYGASTAAAAQDLGWFKPNAPGGGTRPVGQKKPNAFGLFDMSGNVYQWCSDFYAPYAPGPATDPAATTPPGGSEPARRVLRGGSWLKDPARGRSAARYRNTPGSRNADNGFRVVADLGLPLLEQPRGARSTSDISTQGRGVQGRGGESNGDVLHKPKTDTGSKVLIGISIALLVGVPLFLVTIVLIGINRRKKFAAQLPGNLQVTATPAADGFWLRASGPSEGARVHYQCRVGNNPIANVVTLSGSLDTFVYTGGFPSQIVIRQVVPAARPASSWSGGGGSPGGSGYRGSGHASSGNADAYATSAAWGATQQDAWNSSSNTSSSSSEPFAGYPSAY